MSTLTRDNNTDSSRTLLHPNPILRRLSRVNERTAADAATYSGIAVKTCIFLALTMIGMIAQLLVSAAFANAPVWQSFTFYGKFTVNLTLTETAIVGAALSRNFLASSHVRPFQLPAACTPPARDT